MKNLYVILGVLLAISLALTSCAPTAMPAVTEAPATQAPAMTEAPATQAPAMTEAPTQLPTIPESDLVQSGKLLVCSDLPYPPMEFTDDSGNQTGADIDLANEIGKRLGLQVQVVQTVFDTIIAAAASGKCDVVISDMNITAERNKQISFIPYFKAGQSMLALKGNPENINTTTDLCGKSVAAESGTTEVDYLKGTGDYEGKGLTADCTTAGKDAPNVVITQKDSDALQQLQAGKVSVYFADTPVAAYYVVQQPDQFQLVGQVIDPINVGIGVPCTETDCTSAPLTPVGEAVKAALQSMMDDGTYLKILQKWQLQDGALSSAS